MNTFSSELVEGEAKRVMATLADTSSATLFTFASALDRMDGQGHALPSPGLLPRG